MASVASFSGLASGIQWQDMIDEIMQVEAARRVTPLTSQIALQQKRTDAWTAYKSVIGKFADASKALRDGTAFGTYKASAGTGAGGRALVSVAASASAAPGSYKVEVLGLAKAEKLSGNVVASATTALGLSGEFAINGRRITVAATDTLGSLRDRINAANSGGSPSRVSASILSTGSGEHRLVLSSDVAGAAGIDLTDGAEGLLRDLGFADGTLSANTTASGGTATRAVSSVTTAIAASLGVTMPAPSTIKVGGKTITVDLSQDSLSSIAAKIQAQGIPARTVAETVDGRTSYRLEVEGTVEAIGAGDGTPEQVVASQRAIEVLGFVRPGRAAVSQVVSGEQPWQDGGAAATGASLLGSLTVGGDAAGVVDGDTITIRGTDGAGGAVLHSFTVGAGSTVDDLLAQVNTAFGGGSRPATATLAADGTIQLTDSEGGESRLAFSLSVKHAATPPEVAPEAALLGRASTSTVGRQRTVTSGSDASVRVDGVTITRGGNTITDVIAGVTLTLQGTEPGTEIAVNVTRDDEAALNAVKQFASAYNDVVTFVNAQTAQGAPLAANGTLRSTRAQLTNVLLTDVAGLTGGSAYSRATLVGVSLSRTGTLEVDETALRAALSGNIGDVKALFGTAGVASDASLQYVASSAGTAPGSYEVVITTAARQPSLTGSGFGGSYVATGATDRLKVTDSISGKSIELGLQDGASSAQIVAMLNTSFATDGLRLSAALAEDGTNLVITGTEYGATARVTVEYLPEVAGADPFGLAGTDSGVDVAGTIGGRLATGAGRTLTASAGTELEPDPASGLAVSYTGSATGAIGTLSFSRGVGGMMTQVTDILTRSGDGTIASQLGSLDSSITGLARRADDATRMLEMRREAMTRQFAAMEAAIARIQSQGNWLTQQISALTASQQS
ncbi:MAG: flagellar filament capping protein FliD [Gemmatimonadaceae bacterium]